MEILNSIPNFIYYVSLVVAVVIAIAICVFLVISVGFSVRSGNYIFSGGGLAMALLITGLASVPLILYARVYHLTPSSSSTFNIVFWIIYVVELLLGAVTFLFYYERDAQLIPLYLIFMLMALISSSWTTTTIELVIQVLGGNVYATSVWKAIVGIAGVVYALAYFSIPIFLANKIWAFSNKKSQ